jgi:prephenate dehydrogenase
MKIGIIGLGLLGGSMAIALRRALKADIYGQDKYHFDKAKALGLIQFPLTEDQLAEMDIIIIATPVDTISDIARNILDKAAPHTLVFDVGSTKHKMAQALANHPKRQQFLLAHPIAGTEYSGPEAAFGNLFDGKMNIICDVQETDPELLDKALKLFDTLNMQTIQMDSASHDEHIAYVSHLSHISSFMLGKTVLDLEKNVQNIFTMAGSGFASTVRLAKSSPQTWTPIFLENKKPILKALDEYIDNLQDFKAMLYRDNKARMLTNLQRINHIGTIIDQIK